MKLDKIKFARLISFIQACTSRPFEGNEIAHIDDLIDLDSIVLMKAVDELLFAMQTGRAEGYIPAIKAYRAITGAGLKEAKDAVEKYRV